MTQRLKYLIKVLKGEGIVITLDNNKLIVDTGKLPLEQTKNIATQFFKNVYSLR